MKENEQIDDEQIIKLFTQRDERAIQETSNKYSDYCFHIAYNILLDKCDSEECINDTWMKAWSTIPPNKPKSLKVFLAKITRNISFNKLRSNLCQKRGSGTVDIALDEVEDFLIGTIDITDELEQAEFIQKLNEFLYSLNERDCNIFIKRYFYMESLDSIAIQYNLTYRHVLVILSRVRKKLKENLEKEGYTQ